MSDPGEEDKTQKFDGAKCAWCASPRIIHPALAVCLDCVPRISPLLQNVLDAVRRAGAKK